MRYQKILESYLKLCLFGFGTFSMFLIPIVQVHEYGHKIACDLLGGRGEIIEFNRARCHGGSNNQLMWFAGGGFGTLGSLIPWAFWWKWKKSLVYRGILIGASAFAVLEFQKAVWEAADYHFYISDGAEKTFLAMALVAAFILVVILRPKTNAYQNSIRGRSQDQFG